MKKNPKKSGRDQKQSASETRNLETTHVEPKSLANQENPEPTHTEQGQQTDKFTGGRGLTVELLRRAARSGLSLTDIKDQYGYGEEEVRYFLNHTCLGRHGKLLRSLESNSKAKARAKNKLRKRKPERMEDAAYTKQGDNSGANDAVADGDSLRKNAEPEKQADIPDVSERDANPILKDLTARRDRLVASVKSFEEQHGDLVGRRRACINDLKELSNQLDQLMKSLDSVTEQYNQVRQRHTSLGEEMCRVTEQKKEAKKELDSVEEQICQLSVVTVFVENTSQISAVQGDRPYPIENRFMSEGERIYTKFVLEDVKAVKGLTLDKIRVLAHVIAIINGIKKDFETMVIFDDTEIEAAFNSIDKDDYQ
jgi:hypothetical protein